jgi:hypothetical protein
MTKNHAACLAILAVLVAIATYYAMANDGQDVVPRVQTEDQVMGLGVKASMSLGDGTPLDLRPEVHFWSPGTNPRDADSSIRPVTTPHRYPAIPGGNVSTVMHHGWSQFCGQSPSDNDWRLNPPEAAVL